MKISGGESALEPSLSVIMATAAIWLDCPAMKIYSELSRLGFEAMDWDSSEIRKSSYPVSSFNFIKFPSGSEWSENKGAFWRTFIP